ncbi:hypothetical protein Tco_1105830 [Tanacetum coccineum]
MSGPEDVPPPIPQQAPQSQPQQVPHTMSTVKLPLLKKGVTPPKWVAAEYGLGNTYIVLTISPDEEEVSVDAYSLATKPPSIVDWKIHKEGKKRYYQIIRANGSSKIPVEDLDLVLYGDLKTMFDPHVKDQVWKNQSDYRVLEWKIYDSCGVHSLRNQNVHIHMLVEKRYPLTAPTITDMLNKKLKADHWNEFCYQLLKLITK